MTSIADQYRTITTGAGWTDQSVRGRLRFAGRDVAAFLQALVSNDVLALAPGQGVYATYLTPQGRMIADLEVHVRANDWIIETPAGHAAALAARFDSLVFTEDVRLEDVTDSTFRYDIIGAQAAPVAAAAVDLIASDVAALTEPAHFEWQDGIVVRSDTAFVPIYKLIGEVAAAAGVRHRLDAQGAVVLSSEVVESLRIEAGRPLFGSDLTADTIPLEAGLLERAISTTKGCYVGQEIVIRVLHRGGGRVARRLVRLALDVAGEAPAPGAALEDDGRHVGQLTSVAPSLTGPGFVALGYVARADAEPGRRLDVAGRPQSAVITGFAG
jgi:folate-binding protein YgfZ